MKRVSIAIILVFLVLQCAPRTEVRIGSTSNEPLTTTFSLKPVVPIAGPGYAVDTIGVGEVDWGGGIVKAKGTGIIDPENSNKAQARLMAKRAAVVVAQRNLLEAVKGVRVNSETIVENYMTKSDLIYTCVEGVVKGARLIGEPKYDEEQGIVEVEMTISLYDKKGLSDAITKPVPLPEEYKKLAPDVRALLQTYSGVVFDAKGTDLKPSLFPKIYDENGNLLLDTKDYIDIESSYGRRVVQYIQEMDEILEDPDLKDNPLVIKVKDIRGKLGSDIVISNKNADRYKWLKDAFHFLMDAGRTFIKIL